MSSLVLPNFLQPYLWSYDLDQLDLERDREVIITNILNLGNEMAVKWLFAAYPKKLIKETIENAKSGFWHDKSLKFWSLIFGLQYHPELTRGRAARFSS